MNKELFPTRVSDLLVKHFTCSVRFFSLELFHRAGVSSNNYLKLVLYLRKKKKKDFKKYFKAVVFFSTTTEMVLHPQRS